MTNTKDTAPRLRLASDDVDDDDHDQRVLSDDDGPGLTVGYRYT